MLHSIQDAIRQIESLNSLLQAQEKKRRRVKIRTKEKCPKCKKPFQETPVGLLCPKCFTVPRRFFVDLSWKGRRIRVYSFKDGQPLSSWDLAQRARQLIEHEIESRSFDPTKWVKKDIRQFLVRTLVERYIEDKKEDIKPSSLRKKQIWLRIFTHTLGSEDVRDLKTIHIQRFYENIKEGRSPKTIKNILTEVKAFLNWCYKLEIIERVPSFPSITIPEKTIKWLSAETQKRILQSIPAEHQDIFEFLFTYGCRPAEARALAWDCIFFEERLIVFKRTFSDQKLVETPKGGKIYALPMTDEIYQMLKRRYENQRHPFFVFYYKDKLGRIRYYGERLLRNIFKSAYEKINLPEITLYQAVRHSFAMQRLAEGFSLDEIGAVLRHSSKEVTKRYAQYQNKQLLPVIEGRGKVLPFRPTKKRSS